MARDAGYQLGIKGAEHVKRLHLMVHAAVDMEFFSISSRGSFVCAATLGPVPCMLKRGANNTRGYLSVPQY